MDAENSLQKQLVLGKTKQGSPVHLLAGMANRHGLIAGATGTGKTVTLQVLAEQFSRLGVPVFLADVKGDLAGLSCAGAMSERLQSRITELGVTDWEGAPCPVVFWDVFRKNGLPLRTTVSEMGPLLLSRLLHLNDTQADVLQVVFSLADDQGMLLLDLKDLRAMLQWVGDNASSLRTQYGNIAPTSIAAIVRGVLTLEESGGALLFGEPALKLDHLMQVDFSGNGVISVLDATTLLQDSRTYATLLLWLLSELFEQLPEVGDLEKPRLVFFFDEAHLLFTDTPSSLVAKIEQVVRLIRSKGVGVYFVTQNPLDIPESILGQLGNRVQHALRSFTPIDQKAVRTAAQTFRQNPAFDTADAITQLEVGEALVSTLDRKGAPTVVERILIVPPRSRIGPISAEARAQHVQRSPLSAVYTESIDRESAFELLKKRAEAASAPNPPTNAGSMLGGIFGSGASSQSAERKSANNRQGYVESAAKSMLRSIASTLGREVIRGVLGSMRR